MGRSSKSDRTPSSLSTVVLRIRSRMPVLVGPPPRLVWSVVRYTSPFSSATPWGWNPVDGQTLPRKPTHRVFSDVGITRLVLRLDTARGPVCGKILMHKAPHIQEVHILSVTGRTLWDAI